MAGQATADTIDEDPASVRAMPLVLRMERDVTPLRTALLEAAASAAVALCLDERSQPGGPWHPQVQPWAAGRIRKVSRRARGAHWVAVTELPGITVENRGAQVRALLDRWAAADYRCAVRTASAHQWSRLAAGEQPQQAWRERGILAVRDAGFTEVAPGTITVAARYR
jgi:hypothetical protein